MWTRDGAYAKDEYAALKTARYREQLDLIQLQRLLAHVWLLSANLRLLRDRVWLLLTHVQFLRAHELRFVVFQLLPVLILPLL